LQQAVRLLFVDVGDKELISRMLLTDDFLDGFLRITEEISKIPNHNQYN